MPGAFMETGEGKRLALVPDPRRSRAGSAQSRGFAHDIGPELRRNTRAKGPSKKSIKRMVEKVHELTDRKTSWQETTEVVGKLNRSLRGWANYFKVGSDSDAYRALDNYTAPRLRWWLRFKYKLRNKKGGSYPLPHLYRHFGLVRLSARGREQAWAKA